jgi:HEAT repeat protein
LTARDAGRRVEAVNMLAATEDSAALPLLNQALSDQEAEVRLAVIESLAELDFPDNGGADLLSVAVVQDPEADNRQKALEGLVALDSDRLPALARAALNDPNQSVRTTAEQILAKLATPPAQ